jgi:putative Mg2+ transporter-C (MgtC) family protein
MIDWILNQDEVQEFGAFLLRLSIAIVLGGVLGVERQLRGRWAGIRTHMMVSLGAAIFTLAAITTAPNDSNEVTRVIQGIAAGIGFLGAGTILKLSTEIEVKGLTTASSIWLAAALGTVAGMGEYALATASGLMSVLVLVILRPLTKSVGKNNMTRKETTDDHETIQNM